MITSDHGYAATGHFPLTEDEDQAKYMQQTIQERTSGQQRQCGTMDSSSRFADSVAARHRRLVLGRRKWKSPGGYPALAHGGLSILEVAVPFIEISRP